MSHKSIEIRYNRAIDGSDHMQTTSELSASERIFTTAQAKRLGVPRNALAKACAAGRLLRVMHGVYRMAGVPSAETDELEAIWKLTAPSLFTHEGVQPSAWDGIAAGSTTAASIHGIGDSYLSPYVLIAPQASALPLPRRSLRRPRAPLRWRHLQGRPARHEDRADDPRPRTSRRGSLARERRARRCEEGGT